MLVELESFVDSFAEELESLDEPPSFDFDPAPDSDDFDPSDDELRPFADADADDEARESVMYQPLPLKTMPTGWMTLRSAPPQRSQVLSGASEKLWRFSITSSQAMHL